MRGGRTVHFSRRAFIAATVSGSAIFPSFRLGALATTDVLTQKSRHHLHACLEQHRRDWGLPGLTLAIATRGGGSAFLSSGWANTETGLAMDENRLVQIGSLTKSMAALVVWSLFGERRLTIDSLLSDLLPDIRIDGGSDVTVRHLLDHVSGLPGYAPLRPEGGLWVGSKPGMHWAYSNIGYELLGKIVESIERKPFSECLAARIFQPLGMLTARGSVRTADRERYAQGYGPARSDCLVHRPTSMLPSAWIEDVSAAGCAGASARDMVRYLQFLLRLSQGDGRPILPSAQAMHFLETGAPGEGWGDNAPYSNGWSHERIENRRYLAHTGATPSFCASIHVDRDAGIAAFAAANVSFSLGYSTYELTRHACEVIRKEGAGLPLPEAASTVPAVENASRYAGTYLAANGEMIEIVAEGGKLAAKHGSRVFDLQRRSGELFSSSDESVCKSGILFETEAESDTDPTYRLWVGETEYLRDPARGYQPPAPSELQAFAGTYVTPDPWWTPVRIYARDGRLWLSNTTPLARTTSGCWRSAKDRLSAERLCFDTLVGGKTERLLYSGYPLYRIGG